MKWALCAFAASVAYLVSAKNTLTVVTINFGCRDLYPLAACDNCQTRFDLMAAAINGGSNIEGLPNLDEVDVVVAQELGTDAQNFAQISSALSNRGLIHTTGEPSPRAGDRICRSPIVFHGNVKDIAGYITGLDNGGLVTWSRYPILETLMQNWCGHNLPTPAGYLLTLLDVGEGRVAAIFNLHAMPNYDFGIPGSAETIRTYQFGEVSGLADKLLESFRGSSNAAFSVILGGDFNEDAYHFQSHDDSANCGLITNDQVFQKFHSVGLGLLGACQTGIIGKPTWDPTNNDLADRFSEDSTHQVLDYLIQHSSSSSSSNPVNVVTTLKTKEPWSGQFCHDTTLGEAKPNNLYRASAYALSDHNLVTATFTLPDSSGASTWAARIAFNNAVRSWNSGIVDEAACGQQGTVCWTDDDCCNSAYSWNGIGQTCNGIYCAPCAELGQSCGAQLEGSDCCGYYDFTSGEGLHCQKTDDLFSLDARCVHKFDRGTYCLWDGECKSNNCNWLFKCD
ncbi:expressed unknown protein [Seminavis robusta]|uniref:Endonuclease/exonuclease/phosphatase domain-containing protein n=1 Tax=Seminavis robusta TaxID=568900 RepID=A0A9N8H5V9_9STRA|nr:expressed unknown protein [Seminavis robusta]|eukprot:Sro32_g020580.1 n/a (508) ;mRNA; r:5798-7321